MAQKILIEPNFLFSRFVIDVKKSWDINSCLAAKRGLNSQFFHNKYKYIWTKQLNLYILGMSEYPKKYSNKIIVIYIIMYTNIVLFLNIIQ